MKKYIRWILFLDLKKINLLTIDTNSFTNYVTIYLKIFFQNYRSLYLNELLIKTKYSLTLQNVE